MSNPRYQRVSQTQEKEESDGGEDTTLFDKDFGEGAYDEDEDLRLKPPKMKAMIIATKVVPKLPHNRRTRHVMFLIIAVLVVLLIALSLGYVFFPWGLHGAQNCTVPLPGAGGRISWEREFFPGYTETTPIVQDMNRDGYKDVIVTQVTHRVGDSFAVCPDRPNQCLELVGFSPCRVRLAALCGNSGDVIWEKWLDFEAFALDCTHDFNTDDIPDCIVAGRKGSFGVIDGANGTFLWFVDPSLIFPTYNFYYPLVVDDLNDDGVPDLINMHGGDATYSDDAVDRSPGFLVVVSGRTGQALMEQVQVPDGRETYFSPVLYHHPDGSPVVLFGTGGETISGSLWAVTLDSIRQHVLVYLEAHNDEIDSYQPSLSYNDSACYDPAALDKSRPKYLPGVFDKSKDWTTMPQLAKLCPQSWADRSPIWNPLGLCLFELSHSDKEGVILPPVVMDVNEDGHTDLIVSKFGGHTFLLDGVTGESIWDLYLPDTQSYSIPAPIYYNEDNTPDFVIRVNKGSWMIYDYSYMAVADGKTGKLLWTFNSSQGLMSSTLTLLNKRRGYDGTLFVSMGKSKEQAGEMATDQHHEEKRDVCAREYVEDERKMCAAARSEKAARQKRQDNGDPTNSDPSGHDGPPPPPAESVPEIPEDLWVSMPGDTFPDPWNETEAFIEDYCGYPMDSITAHMYFVTPQLIEKGDIRPLYSFKPYVYNPVTSPIDMRQKRHGGDPSSSSLPVDRHLMRCSSVLVPIMMASSPILNDLNNDNKLEVSVPILWSFMPGDYAATMWLHPPKLIAKTFTLEDRFKEVYQADADLVDFSSFYPPSKQPWLGYMGTSRTGEYVMPS